MEALLEEIEKESFEKSSEIETNISLRRECDKETKNKDAEIKSKLFYKIKIV
jgi:hypothetical protein